MLSGKTMEVLALADELCCATIGMAKKINQNRTINERMQITFFSFECMSPEQ